VTSASSSACLPSTIDAAPHHHHDTITTNNPPLLTVTAPFPPTPATAAHLCLLLLFATGLMDQAATESETETACATLPLLPPTTATSLHPGTPTTIPTITTTHPHTTTIALLPVLAIEMTHGIILLADVEGGVCPLLLPPATSTTAVGLLLLIIIVPPPWNPPHQDALATETGSAVEAVSAAEVANMTENEIDTGEDEVACPPPHVADGVLAPAPLHGG